MRELKLPSLLQVARNWRQTPEATSRAIINSAKGRPSFTYNPLYATAWDVCRHNISFEQIERGYASSERRPDVRKKLLEIVPLLHGHFKGIESSYVSRIGPRSYPISRDERISLDAPFLYSHHGEIRIPLFLFWRNNVLNSQQFQLFKTLVLETFEREPDLDEARLDFLDFSAPLSDLPRTLKVQDIRAGDRLSMAERDEMLRIFIEGYGVAKREWMLLQSGAAREEKTEVENLDQLVMFASEEP